MSKESLYVIATVLIVGVAWGAICGLAHLPSIFALLTGMALGACAVRLGIALHDRFGGAA